MRNISRIQFLTRIIKTAGIDIKLLIRTLVEIPHFINDIHKYRMHETSRFPLMVGNLFPTLGESKEPAGEIDEQYFYQDLWAAKKIYKNRPNEHLDVGSRIDGFISHLLTFMPVNVIDIRPLKSEIDDLSFIRADATNLSTIQNNSVISLSCLHAVEHFGLGRYGDQLDPDACFKAMKSFERVLKPGGRLYLSVPIGIERVEFNAHRVFNPRTILEIFSDLILLSFSAIDDEGRFKINTSPDDYLAAWYSCGLFELTK